MFSHGFDLNLPPLPLQLPLSGLPQACVFPTFDA